MTTSNKKQGNDTKGFQFNSLFHYGSYVTFYPSDNKIDSLPKLFRREFGTKNFIYTKRRFESYFESLLQISRTKVTSNFTKVKYEVYRSYLSNIFFNLICLRGKFKRKDVCENDLAIITKSILDSLIFNTFLFADLLLIALTDDVQKLALIIRNKEQKPHSHKLGDDTKYKLVIELFMKNKHYTEYRACTDIYKLLINDNKLDSKITSQTSFYQAFRQWIDEPVREHEIDIINYKKEKKRRKEIKEEERRKKKKGRRKKNKKTFN